MKTPLGVKPIESVEVHLSSMDSYCLNCHSCKFFLIKGCSSWMVFCLGICSWAIMLAEKQHLKNKRILLKRKSSKMEQIKLTALEFPPNCILRSWIQVHWVSSWVDRTNVIWTPKLRWTEEQSMQMKMP